MGDRLKGKVAVVTGAGRGIGRAEALALAAQGARIIVNDLGVEKDGSGSSSSPADEVVEEIKKMGGNAVANYDNVATPEGGEAIIKSAVDNAGRLDILVNNAGNYRAKMIFKMTPEDWDLILKVHLYGHFYCTRPACALFRQQRGGRIINTTSEAWLGQVSVANYCAAKAGIVGLTRAVARDMGKYGVTCNCVAPRAPTRMTAGLDLKKSSGLSSVADVLSKIKPEDLGPLIVYLASDESADINGKVFYAYGGTIALFSEPEPVKTIYKEGRWNLEELVSVMPQTLGKDLVNPAPAQKPK